MGEVVVATSIPPTLSRRNENSEIGETYQRLCIRSWADCGFRVLSLNHADEIPSLAARYPGIEFIPTIRDASSISGRKIPYIADLLSATLSGPEPVLGIVNADILFEPGQTWQRWLPNITRKILIAGQRFDTRSLREGNLSLYDTGFDYFFFDRASAQAVLDEAMPFAIGLAWWDYWLPLTLMLKGNDVLLVRRPSVLHLAHNSNPMMAWRPLGLRLAQILSNQPVRCAIGQRPAVASFLALCRQLASTPLELAERGDLDGRIIELAETGLDLIRDNFIELDVAKEAPHPTEGNRASVVSEGSEAASFFHRFRERSMAGYAVSRASNFFLRGRSEEAYPLFRQALGLLPDDEEALIRYGEALAATGKLVEAHSSFRRAVVHHPNSCEALNALGIAQSALGHREEAVQNFEKILKLDPQFAAAYHNLALMLEGNRRQEDVIFQFEREIASRPDYREGRAWYWRLKQKRARSGLGVPLETYHSRHGEDALLDEFFGYRPSGKFIDIGAGDGLHFSNSYAFEMRGWQGHCLVGSHDEYALCVVNRPRSRCHRIEGTTPNELDRMLGDLGACDLLLVTGLEEVVAYLVATGLERHHPRVLVISKWQDDAGPIDARFESIGYRCARHLGESRFFVRSNEDAHALRAIIVSAKLAHRPIARSDHYVFWPRLE